MPTATDRAQARAALEMCENAVYELRLLSALTNLDELEIRIVAALAAARLEGVRAGLDAAEQCAQNELLLPPCDRPHDPSIIGGNAASRAIIGAIRALDPAACLKES